MAHAHREMLFPKTAGHLRFDRIPQVAKPGKVRPRFFGIFKEWGDRHQTIDPDSLQSRNPPNNIRDSSRFGAELCLFSSEINLNQHRQDLADLCAGPAESGCELYAVNRMDHVKQFRSAFCFVGLEMADQVPFQFCQGAEVKYFPLCFLYAIFSKPAYSSFCSLADAVDGECFADR